MMMLFYLRRNCSLANIDDFILFLIRWKITGNIPNIELRISDKRLFQLINHIQSVPFSQSKYLINNNDTSLTQSKVC